MHSKQKRAIAMFRRVRDLLTTENIDPRLTIPLGELGAIIERMNANGVLQDNLSVRSRSLTVALGAKARVLRKELLRTTKVAGVKVARAKGGDANGLLAKLNIPKRLTDYEGLHVAGQSFANSVAEHEESFAAAGLPKEFLTELRAMSEQVRSIIDSRSTLEQRRMAATKELNADVTLGLETVRMLDGIVPRVFRGQEGRLVEWRKASRIRSVVSGGGTPAGPDEEGAPPTEEGEVQKAAA